MTHYNNYQVTLLILCYALLLLHLHQLLKSLKIILLPLAHKIVQSMNPEHIQARFLLYHLQKLVSNIA